jgi:DNA-binding HxlR family transcriptional regulator
MTYIATGTVKDIRGKILKVISRSGVSEILFSLNEKPKRFSELMFETHLNPGILDRHLKALMEYEIVEKESDSYSLTPKGVKVVEKLEELFRIFQE